MSDSISGARIWLSGAIPDDANDWERQRISQFVTSLANEVFRRGGLLIHGSHPTIRNLLLEAASDYQQKRGRKAGLVLAVSRYFSKEPAKYQIELEKWNQLCSEPAIQTREGFGRDNSEIEQQSLEILRNTLLEQCNIIVAVGGNWWKIASDNAGVPEEISLAAKDHLPLFLLGGLGGATRDFLSSKPELLRQCKNGLTEGMNLELAQIEDPNLLAERVVSQIARLPVRARNNNAGRPFRILSLDGGGIRGVYTAAILAYWEKHTNTRIVDSFDLIAGTSTGGLLAIGLGLGLSAQTMLQFYRTEGPIIFPTEHETDRMWHAFRHWFGSKFDQAILQSKLEAAYDGAPHGRTSLDKAFCRLVIPSYNAKSDQLVVFRTPHKPFESSHANQNPIPIALATAAAPTYFDPVEMLSVVAQIEAVDGGVWANNPGTIAIAEAVEHLGIPIERIDMLSIGTTYSPEITGQPMQIDKNAVGTAAGFFGGYFAKMVAKTLLSDTPIRGKIGWVASIAEFLMKTQAQTSEHVCKALLGNRLLRIDDASNATALDDVKAIDRLTGLGEVAAEKYAKEVRVRFLNGVPADSWQ